MSAARESLAGAATAADRLGGVAGERLYDAATGAFVAGFDLTVGIAGAVMAAAAIAAFFVLPARSVVNGHDAGSPRPRGGDR
ncbi:MAG: hypothetical protein ACRCZP_07025, partial [Phycicoccus sp.]